MDYSDKIARYEEIERRGLLSQLPAEKQAAWAEYKRRQTPQPQMPEITDDVIAQNIANNEAYAVRQQKNRPWADRSPIGRAGVAIAQGVANAGLNPAGYIARAAGIDTKPFTPQNDIERGAELAGEYGFDAAALGSIGNIAKGAGLLGKGQSVASKVAQEVLAPTGITELAAKYVAPAVGGGLVEGATNPTNPFEKVLANLAGAGIVGGVEGMLTKTATNTAGNLKNALPNESANAALSKGVRADKGVARTIVKDAPRAYNELNDDMIAALDRATGRKLNIANALDKQQERYNKFIYQNANNPVYATKKGENLPTLKDIAQGLSKDQTDVLNSVINQGADKVTNPRGSLRAVHRALEVLNKQIDNTINENPLRPRSTQDADVRDLMQVKSRLNQLLEAGGIKPFDAGISKAKSLRSSFETGYNFKPSETKFENLGLKTARDKRAFLQGRLAKIQDNVLSDGGTNLATAVKKDENTLKKLISDAKFKELMNDANSIEEQFKRLKSIETQANNELLKDIERGVSPMRENIESSGSAKGRALDILLGTINRRSRRKLAEAYLNPEINEIKQFGGLSGAGKGLSAAATRQLMIDQLNNQ